MWYLGKIRFQKEDESGSLKTINEAYLVDAVSYTDAEARLYEYIPDSTQNWNLVSLVKQTISEIFHIENGSEVWYKAKVQYVTFDEKSQKEKKTPIVMLINAENPKDAYELLTKQLGTIDDYHITNVNLTSILEIVHYKPENELLKKGNFLKVPDEFLKVNDNPEDKH
ncbi:protein of unknown function [Pseudarcicella hirudinis]|uniref:DUF4494 domain-containing protein n=1 Tax=Pseudarcicella hirudinis TaxID=1079859 RepID=A0A1I5SZI6_9BACT|nr:DUF4494 domain-containing protein [Pseudarcicella hirudinis]SFP76179.1 protein of unknown function [Pseudarcicella hirudinis]